MTISRGDLLLKAWSWVHRLAERRVVIRFLAIHGHDRMCPNCRRWGALGGFDWANMRRLDEWHDGLTCIACGHESRWFMGSMLPTLAPGDVKTCGESCP
jgi:hypothetical protein